MIDWRKLGVIFVLVYLSKFDRRSDSNIEMGCALSILLVSIASSMIDLMTTLIIISTYSSSTQSFIVTYNILDQNSDISRSIRNKADSNCELVSCEFQKVLPNVL